MPTFLEFIKKLENIGNLCGRYQKERFLPLRVIARSSHTDKRTYLKRRYSGEAATGNLMSRVEKFDAGNFK